MAKRTWNADVAHSSINFSVRHMVVSKVRGRFTKWSATLATDDADLTASTVRVDIEAASLDTGLDDRDAHLRSPDFFDVERFPRLVFVSRRAERLDAGRYRLTGDLTIRDVTREVVLDVTHAGEAKDPWGGRRAGFTASTSIDRKDFGLKWNQILETGGLLVGERIDVEIELEAVEAAAERPRLSA